MAAELYVANLGHNVNIDKYNGYQLPFEPNHRGHTR